jgi:hypothetical protein
MKRRQQDEPTGWVAWVTSTDEPDNYQVFDRQLRSRKDGIEINIAGTSPAQFAEGLKVMQKVKVSGLPQWLREATITVAEKPLTLTVATACDMCLETHAAAVAKWLQAVETTNSKKAAR